MSSGRVVLDTDYLIRHGFEVLGRASLVSAVVLQELTAGARDNAEVQAFGRMRQRLQATDALLVPNGEDWWFAGKVLNALYRGLRSHRRGHTPAIPRDEQRRLVRDVLIARTARRANAAVVTYNRRDFDKIRRFCAVRVVEPEEML